MDAIARLTNATSMRIEILPFQNFEAWKPILYAGLESSSKNLRSLTLAFSFEMLSDIIPASLMLPRLESLSLILFIPHSRILEVGSKFSDTATATILPFVNRHSLSLHSINFGFPPSPAPSFIPLFLPHRSTSSSFSLTPLFKGLRHIPQLASASFSASESTDPDSIYQFLKIQSDTLHHLNISFTNNITPATDRIFGRNEILLPHLESFSVDYQKYSEDAIADNPVMKFIIRHAPSLTSLKILGKFHFRRELLDILDPASDNMIFYSTLRYLNIGVQSLTPEIFDVISVGLQNLHRLELEVRDFKRRHTSTHNDEYEFCLEMSRRWYPDWSLKHLNLKRLDERGRESSDRGSHYCISAIVEALPSLQTFNDASRSKYPGKARTIIVAGATDERFPWDSSTA